MRLRSLWIRSRRGLRPSRCGAGLTAALALTFAGSAAGLGCSRIDPSSGASHLRLTHIRPSNAEGLFLNEEVVFYFSEDLDPSSVTSASIEIRSEDGRLARGELRVESDRVRFVPASVLASDLSDGAYLPGTKYTVTLAGFPRPEGVRSARGAVLEKTWLWSFRTVQISQPRTGLVFEDRMQDRVGLLRLFPTTGGQGWLIRAQDSLYLACDKPIDPSTLRADAFLLTYHPTGTELSHPTRQVEPVALHARVIENESEVARRPRPAFARSSVTPEAWGRERRASLIELTPERKLTAGAWELQLKPEAADSEALLRDFSGRPVLLSETAASSKISVDDPSAEAGSGEWSEEFDTRRMFSPVAVPGAEGTAYWGDSGRVEVRYPAAAGSGDDGPVHLGALEDRLDLQATSIGLEKDAECRLRSEAGLVVLRCQGRMSIHGKLVRQSLWDPATNGDPTLLQWTELNAKHLPAAQTLTQWLATTRASGANWTVLIAGGDLAIDGSLLSTTPLLLVAGGRIRISGSVHGASVYLLGEGGGYGITPPSSPAPILVDEPAPGANPLKLPLHFAVLSGPIPPRGEVLSWLAPQTTGSRDPAQTSTNPTGAATETPISGSWNVRYLRELSTVPSENAILTTVDSPTSLKPPGPIQFLVELTLEPRDVSKGVWNPPWVDCVHLAWVQPPLREGPAGGDR